MASVVSKRQQARNERALQDLIKTVPGNDRCADCAAKNPGWASWNLGIFLCMRCAALHRRVGTHVTKVKSLSMDSWAAEQVDNMRKMGNVASNRVYNPQNAQPDIPTDVDEVDAAMEKFVRKKYEQRAFTAGGAARSAARQNTGSTSTGSFNEEPPPLPPKPGKKFGFSLRSSSSVFPRSKANNNFTPPISPTMSSSDRSQEGPSPPSKNKPSQVFGMKITTIDNNFNSKLGMLKDMGFGDDRTNSDVLKSTNGNVDRAVEALVKLGDTRKAEQPRVLTPVSMGSGGAGLSIEKTRQPNPAASSASPWDVVEQPKRSATMPVSQTQNPVPTANNSWNPFLSQPPVQQQQQPSLESSFQNLEVSHTGPAPAQTQYSQQMTYGMQDQSQNNSFQQYQQSNNPWPQQQAPAQYTQMNQPMQSQTTGNPFLRHSRSMNFQSSNPWASAPQSQAQSPMSPPATNPFGMPWQQQTQPQQQAYAQSPTPMYGQQGDGFFATQPQQQMQPPPQMQNEQSWYSNGLPSPQHQLATSGYSQNPYFQNGGGAQQPQQSQQPHSFQLQLPQQQQQQQYQPQQYRQPQQQQQQPQHQYQPQQQQVMPMRQDKSSILALYNMPGFAPPRALQSLPEDGVVQSMSAPISPIGQRSATMPLSAMSTGYAGNSNPFAQQQQQQQQSNIGQTSTRHVSNESVNFQGFAGSGRHSPDAFAGLSSRYMR